MKDPILDNRPIEVIMQGMAEEESMREADLAEKNRVANIICAIALLVVIIITAAVYFLDWDLHCTSRGHSSNYSEGIQYDFQACTIEMRHKENVQPVRFEDDWQVVE